MSVSLWAYDDIKCDGMPCPGDCDHCPIKDEHRCEECKYFEPSPPWELSNYGTCTVIEDQPETRHAVWKACEDFEEKEDE